MAAEFILTQKSEPKWRSRAILFITANGEKSLTIHPPSSREATPDDSAALQKEYDLVNGSIRQLSDIRFKLLGFVPALGGAAAYVLSQAALTPAATPKGPTPVFGIALFGGLIGFLVNLGIVIYDHRNSQLYSALIGRAKYLEQRLKLPHAKGRIRPGGQFQERPERDRRLLGLVPVGHDVGLAIIYAPVLGAWFFPIVYSALNMTTQLHGLDPDQIRNAALASVMIVGLIFFIDFLRLDGVWRKLWP